MTTPLTEAEKKFVEEQATLQKDIDTLKQKVNERQALLRASVKEQLRVRNETLGSWVAEAGLGCVAPEVLQPGLLALGALIQNPRAFAQFCEEWLTAEIARQQRQAPAAEVAAEKGRVP